MNRRDKHNYYLDIAQSVAQRATCLRRKYGAIIVKNDEVISTGYCGAPRGTDNCCDLGTCKREELQIPHGERYELCRSVHAEQNAIISAARKDMLGSCLYLVGLDGETDKVVGDANPCMLCKRLIVNAGINYVIMRRDNDSYEIADIQTWKMLGEI